jgi:CRP/FNR family cyclic AMP-dependent transcriptional regulator
MTTACATAHDGTDADRPLGTGSMSPEATARIRYRDVMSDPALLADSIRATWFGSDLSEASIERLGAMAREYESPARARLLREGDDTKELSILVAGRIALTEHVAGRGSVTLMSAEPGDVFGWSAIIPPYRCTATVVSLEPVKVIAIEAEALRAELKAHAELAAGVYPRLAEALARRLEATRQQLLDVYGSEQPGSF